jgi:hypothetical protein
VAHFGRAFIAPLHSHLLAEYLDGLFANLIEIASDTNKPADARARARHLLEMWKSAGRAECAGRNSSG